MAQKSKENLKGVSVGDLAKKLAELEEHARVIRFKAEGSKSKNVKEISSLRKDIARILTKINEQVNRQTNK